MLPCFRDFSTARLARSFKCLFIRGFRLLAASALILILTAAMGCGVTTEDSSPPSEAGSSVATSLATDEISVDATVNFHGASGETVLRVEVADTESARTTGLMGRSQLEEDRGMIFVWEEPILTGFWMKNTLIPLSIAFLDTDGVIIDIQDMQPETMNMHMPRGKFQYAIEVNQGYYAAHGISVGDQAEIDL